VDHSYLLQVAGADGGVVEISELARRTGLTGRALEREFWRRVGLERARRSGLTR
jgi:hypothetical protein